MSATLYAPEYRAFVQHLIEARMRVGLTQTQLAERLGKPQSYVSKSERFERRIDVAEFRAFVVAMGLNPVFEFQAASKMIDARPS